MRVSAPSPSRAIFFVRSNMTDSSAVSKAVASTAPAAPLANTMAVSLVDESVSMETQLNVRLTTRRKIASRSFDDTAASVKIIEIIVAMSGSIMPTPLATPTTRADDPATVASDTLCTVSVVMMPRATSSASFAGRGKGKAAMPVRIHSIGYKRPMTPVDAMRTSDGLMPNFVATDSVTSSACASPTGPLATFAFFEITTMARAWPVLWRRDTSTDGPANRLLVNTPADVEPALARTTVKSLLSSLTPTLATYDVNPWGREIATYEV